MSTAAANSGMILEPKTTREYLIKEYAALKQKRLPHESIYKDICEYVAPFAGSFEVTAKDRNTRDKQNMIIDNSGQFASDVLRSGLLAGKTSPGKPWFKLETHDDKLNLFKPVKVWLDQVGKLMHRIFQESNTYRALHSMYGHMGHFGIAGDILIDDYDEVIRHYTLPIGEYCVATDDRGEVKTLFREYTLTVEQCVLKFGKRVSQQIMDHYDRGNYHMDVMLLHAIRPRRQSERQYSSKLSKDMAFMSCHMELAGNDPEQKLLSESGFRNFPGLVPRWDTSRPNDAYGFGCGHRALGDIIQLQQEQFRKAQAIDYQANPPLAIPSSLKNREHDTLPGGTSYIDTNAGEAGKISTLFNVNLQLDHLLADIVDVRSRIDNAYFKNLFLMLANQPLSDSSATEILKREEEKIMMIGPVMNRLDNELLDKLIDQTFDRMVIANMLPPPPKELESMELVIQYVSVLSQAQKATGLLNLDRFMTSLGTVAAVKPGILDKVDEDRYADVLADMLGVEPSIVLSGPEVMRIREAKAAQMQQQQQMETANIAADTASKLSQANMNDDNALTRVMQGLGA